nr:MAG TPA: hypothetical protein [Caudoviricetes sp.]
MLIHFYFLGKLKLHLEFSKILAQVLQPYVFF